MIMADIKDIKKALGFDFRATFYSQNAQNLLDDEVVNANLNRINEIASRLENTDFDIEDASLGIVMRMGSSQKMWRLQHVHCDL